MRRSTPIRSFLRVAAALALMSAPAGCSDESGPGRPGRACEVTADCAGTDVCVDQLCVPSDTVDGGGGDGSVDGGGDGSAPMRDAEVVDAGPCRAVSAESSVEPVPVDIIIAIDNSGSMSQEAAEVRRNINNFAGIIAASGLDYRVVLISRPSGSTGVCVPAPLGSGEPMCGSGPEGRLLALHEPVSSTNAPQRVLDLYPRYRDFLRPDSAKVFLWITDDESRLDADTFRTRLTALEPSGMFARQIHNSIVGYYGDTDWSNRSAGTCASLARVGVQYMRLSTCVTSSGEPIEDCTPGHTARVCETDWTDIFNEMAMGVVAGVAVSCEFAMPEPPSGSIIDLEDVRVTYRTGETVTAELERVASDSACTSNGWFYDDPAAPTTITLCPEVCRTVQRDPDAKLDVALGCFPILN